MVSKNQSGFRPGDSYINQLLSITYEIYQSFDDSLEVRLIILDISKTFDKVWYKGLIFNLKQNSVSDKILNIVTDFLSLRKQRVVLNGQASPWATIEAGVSQGSIFEPLIFLIYINDLSGNLSIIAKLFADDTSLFSIVQNVNTSASHLNSDLIKIGDFNGKLVLILTLANKPRKLFSLVESERHVILPFISIISQSKSPFSKASGNDFRHQIKFWRLF